MTPDDFDQHRTDMGRGDDLGFLFAIAVVLVVALWACAWLAAEAVS